MLSIRNGCTERSGGGGYGTENGDPVSKSTLYYIADICTYSRIQLSGPTSMVVAVSSSIASFVLEMRTWLAYRRLTPIERRKLRNDFRLLGKVSQSFRLVRRVLEKRCDPSVYFRCDSESAIA